MFSSFRISTQIHAIKGRSAFFLTWISNAEKCLRDVVLKREPLGSLREEFIFPGRKFVPGMNRGGNAVDEIALFLLLVYSTQIYNCTARLISMGMSTVRKHKLLHPHHRLN